MKTIENEPMTAWLPQATRPIVISGPCSAETEEQVMQTASELGASGKVDLLRAGIWKPRTRPNSFEGVGEVGLPWLKKAGKEIGVPVTTEVANAEHVEACLKHDIDVLWIGARTTVNPFSVQEIADALKGVDIPVMVKNPINPDLQLWIGAMERLNGAGITKLAAIHRGFSTEEKTPFRNTPRWGMSIELKRLYPDLPIICDPSHIAGERQLLGMVSQKAMDMDMDGLMLESHIQPDVALSDANQQVTPAALVEILDELIIRQRESKDPDFVDHLAGLRKDIDELDDEIFEKLSSRMKVAQEIGKYKMEHGVTILQVDRWDNIVRKRINSGKALGLDPEFVKNLLKLVHKESIRNQTVIMNRA